MIWLYIVGGVALFSVVALGVAALLVVAHAADGYERLMENEGDVG